MMKNYFRKLWLLVMPLMLGLAACSDNDENVPTPDVQPEQADYTIIYYGHGGGNLDINLLLNLLDMYKADAESYKHVNICGEYKFSTAESMDILMKQIEAYVDPENPESTKDFAEIKEMFTQFIPYSGKTARFVLDPADKEKMAENDPLKLPIFDEACSLGDNVEVTCPDSLTNFINWAASVRPAKKYILILSDHGGGYRPDEELPATAEAEDATRGVIFDDSNMKHFTAKGLAQAIANARVRPTVLYYDACLMNTAEYLFEMAPLCDYIVASTFTVPGAGGNYSTLINALAQTPDDLEKALTTFTKSTVNSWEEDVDDSQDPDEPVCFDMSVFRTADVGKLGQEIRTFVDQLVGAYQSGDSAVKAKIDTLTAHAYKVEESNPYYDIIRYFVDLSLALPDVFGSAIGHPLGQIYDQMLVYQQSSKWLQDNQCNVDLSVLLGCQGHYIYTTFAPMKVMPDGTTEVTFLDKPIIGSWGSTLEQTYCQMRFDQLTGWSRWLWLNEQEPNQECFSGYTPMLP